MPLTRAELDARIDTNGYPTAAEGITIEGHVWDIYQTPTGQNMIDNWLSDPANAGKNIEFNFDNDNAAAELGTGKVFYDLDFDTANGNFAYLNENGVAIDEQDVGTIAHEMVHALAGKDDAWAGQDDYSGDTVTEANKIFEELGLEGQLSYPGASSAGNLVVGTDYSDGREIDRAWVDGSGPGSDNYTSTGNYRDVLVGGQGENSFNAGAGDDVLHGQGGDDTLKGEAGDDVLFGGAGSDTIEGGVGNDVLYGGDKTAGDNGAVDTLTGGVGDDIYHVGAGDIINAGQDGAGDKIFLDGVELTGPGVDGTGADGATYIVNGDELTVTLNGSSVTIENFDQGKFGFNVPEAENVNNAVIDDAIDENGGMPPMDPAVGGAASPGISMEEAVRILHEEGAEAVELERASGVVDGPISQMIETPAGASVMETLIAHGDTTIQADTSALEGNAYDRVSSVLRGSMERVVEVDKVAEVESRNAEHLESLSGPDLSVVDRPLAHETRVAETEMEYDYGL